MAKRWHRRLVRHERRRAGHPGRRAAQALRRHPGGRRGVDRRRTGPDPGAARPQRRRQDHDGGDDRGAAPAGRGHRPRPRPRSAHRPAGGAAAHRRAAPDHRALSAAHGARGAGPVPHLLRRRHGQRRRADRAARPGREGRQPDAHAVRRPGAAPVGGAGAGQPAGTGVHGRTDHGPGPAGAAGAVGHHPRRAAARRDHPAHHPLHGRGRGALRPGRDHGRRQDHRRGAARPPGR